MRRGRRCIEFPCSSNKVTNATPTPRNSGLPGHPAIPVTRTRASLMSHCFLPMAGERPKRFCWSGCSRGVVDFGLDFANGSSL